MNISIEQARVFDAFARAGTLQAAATSLHKAHTAVLYALNTLEEQCGFALLDRSGYRMRLTSAGEEVLRHCRRLLDAERGLVAACSELRSGWEPVLRVVFDAIVPLGPVLEMVRVLQAAQAPTRVQLSVDSLAGVSARFQAEAAHAMITVLPVDDLRGVVAHPLPALKARLLAHRSHPLVKHKKPSSSSSSSVVRITRSDLAEHVLLTVRGSDPRLHLPTADLDAQSTVHLSDFHAKKAAIVAGIGVGWLPDWLSINERARGALVALHVDGVGHHTFSPTVVLRAPVGPAAEALREHLTQKQPRTRSRLSLSSSSKMKK
jgi:DNA-binding transcriptional LysR family regulator